ncbi:hypothetical protein D3C80_1591830 [compost metagenome]
MIGDCYLRINPAGEIHHQLDFRRLSRSLSLIILIPRERARILNRTPVRRILAVEIDSLHIRLPSAKVCTVAVITLQRLGQLCRQP